MRHLTIVVLLTAGLAACASTPGARPHDMSAADHEAMANRQAQEGAAHSEQYDKKQTVETRHCSSTTGGFTSGGFEPSCWTESDNPTLAHREEAEKHTKMAADHRAASKALRDAESSACVGISEQDRDMSPFHHREDITSVTPISERAGPKSAMTNVTGATVVFRAVPGMTAEFLQRIVDCHLARNAALGHVVPEMPYCPLVPKGVTARVTSTGDGFAVAMRADDAAAAAQVLERARSLKP
jgi:hypothetical protein